MYLTKEETKIFENFKNKKDKILEPVCKFLDKLGFKPIIISWLGLFSMGVFLYFIINNSYLGWFFLILSVFFDNLDGSLARYQKSAGDIGFWADILIDNLGFFIVLIFLIWFGNIIRFWGLVYLINYILIFLISVFAFNKKQKIVAVLRSKYYFFIFYFIDFIWSTNILNPFLVLFGVYMLVMNLSNLLILVKKWNL